MFVVGLEGGGSFTKTLIIDLNKQKIVHTKVYSISSNRYLLGLTPALDIMSDCILKSIAEAQLTLSDILQIGITASGFNCQDPQITDYFKQKSFPTVHTLHDTDGPAIAFQKQFSQPVCVHISGTGEASKIFFNNSERMLSAFGHELSERGCAYSCVRNFIITVIDSKDLICESYECEWRMFCKQMSIPEDYRSGEFLDLLYGKNKKKIAQFAQVMAEKSGESEIFDQILRTEVKNMADLVMKSCRVYEKMGGSGQLTIIKIGGFWKVLNVEKYKKQFFDEIKNENVKLVEVHQDAAAAGAALFQIEKKVELGLFE